MFLWGAVSNQEVSETEAAEARERLYLAFSCGAITWDDLRGAILGEGK